jgi:hypothetical protein
VKFFDLFTRLCCLFFFAFLLVSCTTESSSTEKIPISELDDYETIISFEDEVLATPVIMKYTVDSTLFVYDQGLGKVLALKESGEVIHEYGQKGRGPGEFQLVNNIYVSEEHLYVTDPGKYAIHKFNRNGELNATFNYGDTENQSSIAPPPPPMGLSVQAKNINNQPFIFPNGNMLLSGINFEDSTKAVFNLVNWEGEQLSSVGEIPAGSTFILDYEKIREDVQNRVSPSYYRSNAFPVNNDSNQDEYFLVYSALPKIAKHDASGEKIWEAKIPNVPEIDSVTNRFFTAMEKMQRADIRNRILLEYYTAGVSAPNGNLFLAMNRNPLWIHKFNADGKLIKRYKLASDETELQPIFDIDFNKNRLFILTEEGEVRAYSL